MPKINPLVSDIHAIYSRQAIHVMVYAFIRGAQRMLPSISKKEAAEAFLIDFNVFVDGYDWKDIVDIYDSVNRDVLNKKRGRNQGQ